MTRNLNVERRAVFSGHNAPIYTLSASNKANSFISAGGEGMVAEWDLDGNADGKLIVKTGKTIYSVVIDRVNSHMITGCIDGGIHVIDLGSQKEIRLMKYHEAPIYKLMIDTRSGSVISLDGDGVLCVAETGSFNLLQKIDTGSGKLRSVDFDHEGRMAAVGSGSGNVIIFSLPDWKVINKLSDHEPEFSVNAVKFDNKRKRLLTGSRDAHLNIYDLENGIKLLKRVPAHNYAIYSIAFSPAGDLFATSSRDKTVKIWDAADADVLMRIDKEKMDGHVNSVNDLHWHTSGVLLSAGDDRSVMAWNVDS